jgi:ATPase involved in DNA repair
VTTDHSLRRAGSALLAMLAGVLVLFASAPAASATAAAPDPNTILSHWRDNSDPLYVESGSPLTSEQQAEIREALEDSKTKIYVAALADASIADEAAAGNLINNLGRALEQAGRPEATVAVLDGTRLYARSSVPGVGRGAAQLANRAASANSGDIAAGMKDFVNRVNLAAQGDRRAALDTDSTASSGGGGGGFGVLIGLLVLFLVGGVGLFFYSRKKQREREERAAAELAAVKQTVEEDITKLGEEITELDADVKLAQAQEGTQEDWKRALDAYERAKLELAAVKHVDELRNVTNALEEGRYALACVRARVNNEPVPERRAPCFFNPQHGPSVRDVRWAPPGGAPRDVPACAADAQRVEQGFDPETREVWVDGHRRPYYDAGPAYAPYAYGYYGGFGDVMTGMLVGTMLGSMIGGGFGFGGFGAGYGAGYAEGVQDAGGFGGGDFGGGADWSGGGDWGGGGDFGGGDFGGDW